MIHTGQPKWLLGISTGLFLCGLMLVASSLRTEHRAKALPRMSCEELIRKGRAAPLFMTLTDVQLCGHGHVFRRDMDAAIEMYVPAYSNSVKEEPEPVDLVLLLEILDDREAQRLLEHPAVGELTVELWTDAGKLDGWVGNDLAVIYPGIRLANCRVLSVGLHEPSLMRARREWRDGMGMLVLAAACQVGGWAYRKFGRFSTSASPPLQAA